MTDRPTGSLTSPRTWAVVPYRGHSGKQRLAGFLSGSERRDVILALLGDVLDALEAVATIERVFVVAPSTTRLPSEAGARIELLAERDGGGSDEPVGLNPALVRAQAKAMAAGVDRLLIVPADLPVLSAGDVEAVLHASETFAGPDGVVIAPDGADGGTNALLLAPPAMLPPRFGVDSFRAHLALASELGVDAAVVRRAGLALDLDTPADVARLLRVGTSGRTLALARSLQLGHRLALAAG